LLLVGGRVPDWFIVGSTRVKALTIGDDTWIRESDFAEYGGGTSRKMSIQVTLRRSMNDGNDRCHDTHR
jgi:hypothetical protein